MHPVHKAYILKPMAKVMISAPESLLNGFDEVANRLGKSRSGLLQELMADCIERESEPTTDELTALLDRIRTGLGGDAVATIKSSRSTE